jgi:hypothetical protein
VLVCQRELPLKCYPFSVASRSPLEIFLHG